MPRSHLALGAEGELRAARFLARRGYRILARNVRADGVEIDLVAARGALPLPPAQLVPVVFALTFDADPEVKEAATATLEGFPERVVDPVLESEAPPQLLGYFSERFRDDESRSIKIAVNQSEREKPFILYSFHRLSFQIATDICKPTLIGPRKGLKNRITDLIIVFYHTL